MSKQRIWKKLYKLFRIIHTSLLSLICVTLVITLLVIFFRIDVDEEGHKKTFIEKLLTDTTFKGCSLMMTIFGAIAVILTALYGLRWIIPYIRADRLISHFEKQYDVKLNKVKMWWDTLGQENISNETKTRDRLMRLYEIVDLRVITNEKVSDEVKKPFIRLYLLMEKYHILEKKDLIKK